MIASRFRNPLLALAVLAGAAFCPALSQAVNLTYHVDLNVTSLLGTQTTGNYYLDFQLNGDGLPAAGTNTVTLTNFAFTLGGATGTATTFEGASGNLNAGVTLSLNSTNTANELYQGFSVTTTDIQFDVTTTGNGSGITPDLFLVEILNNSLNSIATNAPDGVSLLDQPINGTVTLAGVSTYRSTNPAGVITSAVPEPSTWTAALLGLGVLARVVLRRLPSRA